MKHTDVSSFCFPGELHYNFSTNLYSQATDASLFRLSGCLLGHWDCLPVPSSKLFLIQPLELPK